MNKQDTFEGRRQILLILCGLSIVFRNFEKHIGARRMDKQESRVQPVNQQEAQRNLLDVSRIIVISPICFT
jgi:hypothetical protein